MADNYQRVTRGLIYLGIIIGFSSCDNSPQSDSEGNYQWGIVPKKTDRVSFPIDTETRGFTLNIRQFESEGGREYLLHHNPINNSIGIYDIDSVKKVRQVYYETVGPNGVGEIDGFDLVNYDSIFLLSRYAYKVSMAKIPEDSDTLKLYDAFKTGNLLAKAESTPFASVRAPIALRNDSLFLAAIPFIDPNRTNMYRSGHNLVKVSLKDYQFSYHNFATPVYDNPWTIHYSRMSYAYNAKEQLMIFSLPIDDSLQTIDRLGVKKKYLAKSALNHSARPYKGSFEDEHRSNVHYMTQNNYGYIMYDRYRDLYYRFTENEIPNVVEKYGKEVLAKNIGVMVLDNQFNSIGETEYLTIGPYPVFFIGRKGLYHMLGQSDENLMTFDLYEIPHN